MTGYVASRLRETQQKQQLQAQSQNSLELQKREHDFIREQNKPEDPKVLAQRNFEGISYANQLGQPDQEGSYTRRYLDAVAPEMNIWEKFSGQGAGNAGGQASQSLASNMDQDKAQKNAMAMQMMQLQNQKYIAELDARTRESIVDKQLQNALELQEGKIGHEERQQEREHGKEYGIQGRRERQETEIQERQHEHEIGQLLEQIRGQKGVAEINIRPQEKKVPSEIKKNEAETKRIQEDTKRIAEETKKIYEGRNQRIIDEWLKGKITSDEMVGRLAANGVSVAWMPYILLWIGAKSAGSAISSGYDKAKEAGKKVPKHIEEMLKEYEETYNKSGELSGKRDEQIILKPQMEDIKKIIGAIKDYYKRNHKLWP